MATSLSAKQQKELRQEKLIQEEIDFTLKEIGREIYAFNEANELKIYLENKFGMANIREMLKVLRDADKDKIEELEGEVSNLNESLKQAGEALKLLIPEPSTLNWNYDQLPEHLSPQEKDLVVWGYKETQI